MGYTVQPTTFPEKEILTTDGVPLGFVPSRIFKGYAGKITLNGLANDEKFALTASTCQTLVTDVYTADGSTQDDFGGSSGWGPIDYGTQALGFCRSLPGICEGRTTVGEQTASFGSALQIVSLKSSPDYLVGGDEENHVYLTDDVRGSLGMVGDKVGLTTQDCETLYTDVGGANTGPMIMTEAGRIAVPTTLTTNLELNVCFQPMEMSGNTNAVWKSVGTVQMNVRKATISITLAGLAYTNYEELTPENKVEFEDTLAREFEKKNGLEVGQVIEVIVTEVAARRNLLARSLAVGDTEVSFVFTGSKEQLAKVAEEGNTFSSADSLKAIADAASTSMFDLGVTVGTITADVTKDKAPKVEDTGKTTREDIRVASAAALAPAFSLLLIAMTVLQLA